MTKKRVIYVHPGPYRCLVEGCRKPACYGEGFSMKERGEGWCSEHWRERKAA